MDERNPHSLNSFSAAAAAAAAVSTLLPIPSFLSRLCVLGGTVKVARDSSLDLRIGLFFHGRLAEARADVVDAQAGAPSLENPFLGEQEQGRVLSVDTYVRVLGFVFQKTQKHKKNVFFEKKFKFVSSLSTAKQKKNVRCAFGGGGYCTGSTKMRCSWYLTVQ